MKTDRTISAKDGFPLEVTTWTPEEYQGAVFIGPAMGVKRKFYHAFANFLMENGLAAVTMDFRGIGGSKSGSVSDVQATVTTWAEQDLGGTLQWMAETYPDVDLFAVCHSLSGQILGLVPEARSLKKIVTVVSAAGYWNSYPFPKNLAIAFVWGVLYPLPAKLLGYFPGEALGIGEDLPAEAALQIARWGRSPEYIGDYSSYKNIEAPILSYSFEDDPYCPKNIVDNLHDAYSEAPVTRRHIDPDDLGHPGIGHFGFFRSGTAPALWEDVVEWLMS